MEQAEEAPSEKQREQPTPNSEPSASSAEEKPAADREPEQSTSEKLKLSAPSQALIDASKKLLEMRSSRDSLGLTVDDLPPYTPTVRTRVFKSRSSSPDSGAYSLSSTRFTLSTPRFKRVDFDDMVDDAVDERKPAWKCWQDSIKDSYYNVRKTAERNRDEIAFLDSQLERRPRRSQSPFEELPFHSLSRRLPSYRLAESRTSGSFDSSGPYAAPTLSATAGIESRYDSKVEDIEARLLKTSILPESMKTVTKREPRKTAPAYSTTINSDDEAELQAYMPRSYYSRPNRDDPDYFDFDLQHSVDMFKRPEGKYVPKGPQVWEEKLLGEVKAKGDAPLSGYMFTKGDGDWRTNGTSYLSAALRTPSFWEHRFSSMGTQVRDSNPISLESISRNKPVPSRWTEYQDPELDDDLYDST